MSTTDADELLRGVRASEPRMHYRMGETQDPEAKPWTDLLDRTVETVTTTNVL
jgi:hypothetical protein